MSDLTRYRIDKTKMRDGWTLGFENMRHAGAVVPDSTLQDIADTWNAWRQEDISGIENGPAFNRMGDLLDALVDDGQG